MKYFLLFSITLLSILSCKKVFLGEDQENTPENNFELFWNDFDLHYGLFEARQWNWDSIYTAYRPQINPQTTNEELWLVFRNMIDYLDDSHTFIYSPDEEYFINGDSENIYASANDSEGPIDEEFSIDLLKSKYIENIKNLPIEEEGEIYLYGKVKNKNIGYTYFNDIGTSDQKMMDNILTGIEEYKAIIIDIRNNHGGSDETAEQFAGRFADGEHLIYTVETRNGPSHNDFSDKISYYTQRIGDKHFSKPVIILTDEITVSGAEIFLLHMKAFKDVTQIGTHTSGDFSDTGMRRFLPNGWEYQYSIMMYLLPNGESLDGIGHAPDVPIKNTVADIEAGNDKVLEEAIQYLFDKYGIE